MGRKDLLILLSPAIKVIIDVEVIVNVLEGQTGNLRDKVANANMEFTALHRKTPCERDKKTQQKNREATISGYFPVNWATSLRLRQWDGP
jgi:hypothetical protein